MRVLYRVLTTIVVFGLIAPELMQGSLLYDNNVSLSNVNNGRVNDPNFPSYLADGDNFTLTQAASINQVSWLGAYKNGDNLPDNPDNFTINFYAFSGGIPATTPFASETAGGQRVNTGQTLIFGTPIYAYTATFPLVPLGPGTFLIEIRNSHLGTKSWLWCDLDASPGDSYQRGSPTASWQEFNGNGVAEYAFSISGIPEPTGTLLLALGGFVMGVFHRRCFRRTAGDQLPSPR